MALIANLKVTPAQLAKFKIICHKYGFELDDAKALQQARSLLNLIAITRQPPPNDINIDDSTNLIPPPTSGVKQV